MFSRGSSLAEDETNMSSDVLIEFRSNYLHAQLSLNYEITPESVTKFWSAIGDARKKYDCKLVLAEGKISSRQMMAADAYNSGKQAGEFAPLRLACLLYDHSPDEVSDFFKIVALNRGVLVEYFTNRVKALRWLGVNPNE